MSDYTIRVLQPGDEALLEEFLLPRIDSSMFLIGNARNGGLVDHGERYQGTYAAAVYDGQITGVVAHFWNHNIMVQSSVSLAELCQTAIKTSGRPVKGLLGPAQQVEAIKTRFQIAKDNLQVDSVEDLFRLTLSELCLPKALKDGIVQGRLVTYDDLDLLIEWQAAYAQEALGEADTPAVRERRRDNLTQQIKEQRSWLLEQEGIPVACSAFNAVTKEAVQIGGVWTPLALRGRGYARAVVAASLIAAHAQGIETAILFTGINNIAAHRAYIALGFRKVGDYRIVLLHESIEMP
ncbi:MAG: GNAT family N-acetyltransferase [Chloroflexota bacterium]